MGDRVSRRVMLCAWAALVVVSALLAPDAAVQAQGAGEGFSDVSGGVHKPSIDALNTGGFFEGTLCGDGRFCPRGEIQRWVMAVWLVRILDDDNPPAVAEPRFADVDPGVWWLPYVERLADLEIAPGCGTEPARYCPDRAVTRAEMASFLARAFKLKEAHPAGFTDTADSDHAADIDALAAAGITVGCKTGPLQYCPAKDVTRAELATFLARATGLVETPDGDLAVPLLGAGEAVAFLSDRGEGLEWFVVDGVGSPARQLTEGLVAFEWSPDRSRLAYTTAGGLVVVGADGSGMRMLVEGAVSSPNWSPDGAEIAYVLQADDDASRSESRRIHIVGLDGSGPRGLVRGREPRWSPDGARIMYEDPVGCCDSSGRALWATSIIDLDSGESYTVGGEFREGHIGRVAALWSPDGAMVAYTHDGDIFMLRLDEDESEDTGTAPRPAAPIVVGGRAVAWSPDSRHVAYLQPADASCAGVCDELWITDIGGTAQTYIANTRYGSGSGFEWSPDGTSIAFVSEWAGGLKLVDIASTAGTEEPVALPLPGSFAPSWSSDSSRIAFASENVEHDDMQDDADIYVATADGKRLVRLTEDEHHNVVPTWVQLLLGGNRDVG